MSFKQFSFPKHVEMMDKYPGEQVAITVAFTTKEMEALARVTGDWLTQREKKTVHVDFDLAKKLAPLGGAVPLGMVGDAVCGGVEALITAFATIGYASEMGRKIEIVYGEVLPNGSRTEAVGGSGVVIPGAFASFENRIVEGAQLFYEGIYAHVGRPRAMALFAFAAPCGL